MNKTPKNNISALITLISVFFFWGFVAAGNDILIPVFKAKFQMEQWQSMLISFIFYIGYTVGSVIYLYISTLLKKDVLQLIGYKKGIALGLLISAFGAFLFLPAALLVSYPITLLALFIVALGFSLQQTAANPLAVFLGNPKDGNKRLSLAGGVNNVGTTIAPFILSYAIFGSSGTEVVAANIDIGAVKVPYLVLCAAFVLAAILFYTARIPEPKVDETVDTGSAKSALSFPQLKWGMLAIFLYVGVEVSTGANLGEFMKAELGYAEHQIAPFVGLFWASLMIGRWSSAADAFSVSTRFRNILRMLLPFLAFGIFMLAMLISKTPLQNFLFYSPLILILIAANFLSKGNAAKQLFMYSILGAISIIIGMILPNAHHSVFAFMAVGLFCSTLWPCVFTLAMDKLGNAATQGSSYLVMMIMGGGIVSMLQAGLADYFVGIRYSYIVGVLCFAYLAWYAYKAEKWTA